MQDQIRNRGTFYLSFTDIDDRIYANGTLVKIPLPAGDAKDAAPADAKKAAAPADAKKADAPKKLKKALRNISRLKK
jgi:hypothetical protein